MGREGLNKRVRGAIGAVVGLAFITAWATVVWYLTAWAGGHVDRAVTVTAVSVFAVWNIGALNKTTTEDHPVDRGAIPARIRDKIGVLVFGGCLAAVAYLVVSALNEGGTSFAFFALMNTWCVTPLLVRLGAQMTETESMWQL